MNRRALLCLALFPTLACVAPLPLVRQPAMRVSEALHDGDPTRQASQRLVVEGLEARGRRAQGLFERALQVDSSNPYAYLALARHHVQAREPDRALDHLRRAEDLFHAYRVGSPRVDVHLWGLRGAAYRQAGRVSEAAPWLERAAAADPQVWGDGELTANELR